jgi:hypothetical protein
MSGCVRSRALRLLRLIALIHTVALAGCEQAAPPRFELALTVRSDRGEPVAGARISLGAELAGTSDARGQLGLGVSGREGDRLELGLACPAGFAAEPEQSVLILRRVRPLNGGEPAPLTHALRCTPTAREAVVLVHAAGARHVPVALDGARVATTDAHGFAHVYVSRAPGSRFEVTLDTSQERELAPRSPRRSFELGDADALFVFDQSFESRARRAARPAAPPEPPKPTRLR